MSRVLCIASLCLLIISGPLFGAACPPEANVEVRLDTSLSGEFSACPSSEDKEPAGLSITLTLIFPEKISGKSIQITSEYPFGIDRYKVEERDGSWSVSLSYEEALTIKPDPTAIPQPFRVTKSE